MIPTFRPDRLLEAGRAGWPGAIAELAEASGIDTGDYAGYIAALEQRRRFFITHGATAADHGHADARTDPLDLADASRIYRAALAGRRRRPRRCLPAAHGARDGPDVMRGRARDDDPSRCRPWASRADGGPFGPDTGHDIPVTLELTTALRPLLERYGTRQAFTSSSSRSTRPVVA